ncbi:hypothetical protein SAY86_007242 [Trapa natans]|uniref:NAC domain-containing protein n=1 Tax=Trapa natans TaxID=22666 RepID=A0AAN7R1X9_TRANT|nr:hypothetical protein SAY86_007242 [Trapa natans]
MENLPPGYRFYPTEEELVYFYLRKKLDGMKADLSRHIDGIIPTMDIYEFNPWDLPRFSGEVCRGDSEQWFFFIPRKDSDSRGGRPNRLTNFGYWKATGSPGYVYSSANGRIIGFRRTMVFYNGRAPSGIKTDWKMNEYMVLEEAHDHECPSAAPPYQLRQEYSVCRVYKKSKSPLRAFDRRPTVGVGPSNNNISELVFDGDLVKITATPVYDHGHRYQHHHQITCNHNTNPLLEVERRMLVDSSSPEISSSFIEVGDCDQMAGCSNDEQMLCPDDIDMLCDWIAG